MLGFLLDTNQIGKAIKPRSLVRQRIIVARQAGQKVGTCIPVLCELEVGILQVHNQVAYRESLGRLLREVRIWPLDLTITAHYGRLYQELRQAGRVLSQVDMMVAALALQMKLTVVTSDQDYQAIPGLSVIDWST